MGAWGGFVIFDFAKFQKEVIPSFKEGENALIIQNAIHELKPRRYFENHEFQGLSKVMSFFNEDLSECSLGKTFIVNNGEILKEGDVFEKNHYWNYEDLAILFEYVFSKTCFEFVTNFGLSHNILQTFVESKNSFENDLIKELSSFIGFWKHSSGGWSEGIHGWLTIEETELLATGIDSIALKDDFKEKENLQVRFKTFKKMIEVAARTKKGVLWGADLNILYAIDWKGLELGSIVKINQDITTLLNTASSADGEVIYFK